MTTPFLPPGLLYGDSSRINLYYVHHLYKKISNEVSRRMKSQFGFDIPITSGMWGGSYLIAREDGQARTNVIRLYSINSLPQNGPLDDPKHLDFFMETYQQTLKEAFAPQGVDLRDPRWGEPIPYTNRIRPNIALQMWDRNKRANFARAFFVWNTGLWEEAIIYDTVRNIKQIKEYLNADRRPVDRPPSDYKFVLQDVLIIYFALKPVLTADFIEHAQPVIDELFELFLKGLNDPDLIREQYLNVYNNFIVYGFEEGLAEAYQRDGLDIARIEDWPVEKINWVPEAIRNKLTPMMLGVFEKFEAHLKKLNKPTFET